MELVILGGLILGLTSNLHCIGMCGPIALAVPVNRKNNLTILRDALTYNIGRIITYSLLGLLVGSIGITVETFGVMQWISMIAGIVLIIYAWRKYLSNLLPTVKLDFGATMFVSRSIGKLMRSKSNFKLPVLGFLNGLLPCGMVYVAMGNAMLAGSMTGGMLAMLAFGVGTMPGMMFVTFMANRLNPALRVKLSKAVPYVLTILGALVITRGLNLGIPFISPKIEMAKEVKMDDQSKQEPEVTMSCCHSKKDCD